MSRKKGKRSKSPAKQAINPEASPVNGLVPPVEHRWKPGQSGNPAGRQPAGMYVREHINTMHDWTQKQLENVADDPNSPAAMRAAARVWLDAVTRDRNNGGTPIAGAEFDRIMDRTDGKPHQASTVKIEGDKPDPVHTAMAAIVGDAEALAAARLIAKKLDSKRDDG